MNIIIFLHQYKSRPKNEKSFHHYLRRDFFFFTGLTTTLTSDFALISFLLHFLSLLKVLPSREIFIPFSFL